MTLIIAFFFFVLSVAVLIKSSDFLVDGATSIAAKLKISPIVIGLTIVAFGTSAPELVVSLTSALQGSTEIAFANVIGSNIANILLILGISGLIYPLTVHNNTTWKEIPLSLVAVLAVAVLALEVYIQNPTLFFDRQNMNILGQLGRSDGIILLFFFGIFLYYTYGISRSITVYDDWLKILPNWKSVLFVLIGIVGLTFAGNGVTQNAIVIAQILGLSEKLIGLTIIAVGTSLPELSTSITAALKKQSDIAVGNVIGSNIFNIFFILGSTLLVQTIPITTQNVTDIFTLIVITIYFFLSLFMFTRNKIGRIESTSFIILYITYISYIIYRG